MLRFLTAGESHGQGLVAILEGMVAGLPLSAEDIAHDLARRQKGFGRGPRMQIEQDRAQILSGVRHGQTMGSPIALLIPNRDWENWREAMAVEALEQEVEPLTRLRPGHADLAGVLKYGLKDVRPILERASARETAARVAVGAICRCFLTQFDIQIHSHTRSIGGVWAPPGEIDWGMVEASPVRCADVGVEKVMIAKIEEARQAGDSLGGVVEVVAIGVPPGLGSHAHWERRLDGRLAQAWMSIPAVKGVEIGLGFEQAQLPGSQVHDVILPGWQRATNRAGGIEGGMSNGQPVWGRLALKPIPTLASPLPSVDLATGQPVQAHYERSDICVVPAAGVVAEAMTAFVLAQAFLEKFGGDNLTETKNNFAAYMASLPGGGG